MGSGLLWTFCEMQAARTNILVENHEDDDHMAISGLKQGPLSQHLHILQLGYLAKMSNFCLSHVIFKIRLIWKLVLTSWARRKCVLAAVVVIQGGKTVGKN